LQNSANRLLARAAHYSGVETGVLTEPDPEGTLRAVFFADSAEFSSASELPPSTAVAQKGYSFTGTTTPVLPSKLLGVTCDFTYC
jgi:hypothetical protein